MASVCDFNHDTMPRAASSEVLDGAASSQRRHILGMSGTFYTHSAIKNESFDLISEPEHPSEVSYGQTTPESCRPLLNSGTRSPTRRASFSARLLPAQQTTSTLGSSLIASAVELPLLQLPPPRVQSFGVASDQGIRSSMEDAHVALLDSEAAFFGVYDGHGGRQCAEYLRDHLHHAVLQHADVKSAPRQAMAEAFAQMEREFLALGEEEQNAAGCVCAAALVQGDTLTVGNVGDCEIVLARGGEPMVLTVRHNPSHNDAEAARVIAAGGCIVNRRVGHPRLNPRVCSLAVSRAIGDSGFKLDAYTLGKPSGVIADADTCEVQLTADDRFVLIACDGLWDTMTYTEALELCTEYLAAGLDAHDVADKLVSEALMRGTRDNVTVVFVLLACESVQTGK